MYQTASVFSKMNKAVQAFSLFILLSIASTASAGICVSSLMAVSKIYGPLQSNQERDLTDVPHVPDFLTIDPGSTVNYQRQLPALRCNGCTVLFSASLNGYYLENTHIPSLRTKEALKCLLARNVSLTISDGIQSHTFEVWDYDRRTDELLVVDFAPEISMLQHGRNFSGISGVPQTLNNGLVVFSLRLSDIYAHLTSVHFLIDPEQFPDLSRALSVEMSPGDVASQLVLASAISRNFDGLKRAMKTFIELSDEPEIGKLGSLILYLLDFRDGQVEQDTLQAVWKYFPDANYNEEKQVMIFALKDIGQQFFLPIVNSDYPDLVLDLFARDLSNEAGIVLINEWYPDIDKASTQVLQLLSELYYQARRDENALSVLTSLEAKTLTEIRSIIRTSDPSDAVGIFNAYIFLDQPLNLELEVLRSARREILMTMFSMYHERDGVSSVDAMRLANRLVLEYPDFPEHWLNYATLVSRRGEASCAHALTLMGFHFSKDGEKYLEEYVEGFQKADGHQDDLLGNLEGILISHPVLSRASMCKERGYFPRCFEESRSLEQHTTQISADSCLRFLE